MVCDKWIAIHKLYTSILAEIPNSLLYGDSDTLITFTLVLMCNISQLHNKNSYIYVHAFTTIQPSAYLYYIHTSVSLSLLPSPAVLAVAAATEELVLSLLTVDGE